MNVRKKSYKKQALASLFWYLGPDFKFAVKLFALVQKATPSKSVAIDLRTNDVLKATGAYIDNDTGLLHLHLSCAGLASLLQFLLPESRLLPMRHETF